MTVAVAWDMREIQPELDEKGYVVLRGLIPREAVQAAARHINLEFVRRAPTQEQMNEWVHSVNWFPHLRWDAEIVQLMRYLPGNFADESLYKRGWPQILLHFPHVGEPGERRPHQDQLPDWAEEGEVYAAIFCVALSDCNAENGGLAVHSDSSSDNYRVLDLKPGDVLMMRHDTWHSGGYNMSGMPRYMVYLRFIEK